MALLYLNFFISIYFFNPNLFPRSQGSTCVNKYKYTYICYGNILFYTYTKRGKNVKKKLFMFIHPHVNVFGRVNVNVHIIYPYCLNMFAIHIKIVVPWPFLHMSVK